MRANLSNGSYVEYSIEGKAQHRQTVRITNGSIDLELIPASSNLKSTTIVMRNPEIQTEGRISIEEYGKSKTEIEDGILVAKVRHVDHFHDTHQNESRLQFLTYLNDIQIEI